jgi:Tfp pilus assembly protein PilZ
MTEIGDRDDGQHPPAQARVAYRLPLTIEGDDATATAFTERTYAVNVTRRGAFIETERPLTPGALLAIYDANNYGERIGYVQIVWVREEVTADEVAGVGVKLVSSDNTRWIDYLITHSVRALDSDEP